MLKHRFILFLCLVALTGVLAFGASGCAVVTPPQQRAATIEPELSAAGFRLIPANTPAKLAHLKKLPQLHLHYYAGKEGSLHYWMADARNGRLYVGNARDYQRFEKLRVKQRIADERRQAAQDQLAASQQIFPFWDPY